MKVFRILLVVLGVLLLRDTHGRSPAGNAIEGRTISTCTDIPAGATLAGELTIDGHIDCLGKVKRIKITGDSTIRTSAEKADISMRNVLWFVQADALATFIGSTVRMERSELLGEKGITLVYALGVVDFQVDGWHSDHDRAGPVRYSRSRYERKGRLQMIQSRGCVVSPEGRLFKRRLFIGQNAPGSFKRTKQIDANGLVKPSLARHLRSEQKIHFTKNAIVVADPESSPNKGRHTLWVKGPNGDMPFIPDLSLVGGVRSRPEPARRMKLVPWKPQGTSNATLSLASSVSRVPCASVRLAKALRAARRMIGKGACSLAESPAGALSPFGGVEAHGSHPSKRRRRNAAPSARLGGPGRRRMLVPPGKKPMIDLPSFMKNKGMTPPGGSDHEAPEPPPGGSQSARAPATPPSERAHQGATLKVGDNLSGRLRWIDGSGGPAFADVGVAQGGHVTHRRSAGEAPVDARGRRTGPTPTESNILVEADGRKMARIARNRRLLDEQEKEKERIASGGDTGRREKVAASVMAWMPYGEGGFLRRRELEHARANLGKEEMRITSRGKVETSVDGTTVSRVSGPSWFAHLRRDDSHELRTTEDGFEVTRRGKYVWGMRIQEV